MDTGVDGLVGGVFSLLFLLKNEENKKIRIELGNICARVRCGLIKVKFMQIKS